MSEYTALFERAGARVEAPALPLDALHHQCDRKRRNRRITASIVGVALAVVAIFAATQIARSPSEVPVAPSKHNGDITVVTPGGLLGISPAGAGTTFFPCCNPSGGWIEAIDWAPHGDRLAYVVASRAEGVPVGVYVFDPPTNKTKRIVEGTVQSIDWSPDGTRIAYADLSSGTGASAIRSIGSDGSGLTTLWQGQGAATDISWGPDGTQITFAVHELSGSSVHVVDLADTRDRVIARKGRDILAAPAWSPDGSTIAYFDGCGIRRTSPDGARLTGLTSVRPCDDRDMSGGGQAFSDHARIVWSPDGSRLAVSLPTRGSSFPLLVMDPDGSMVLRLRVPGGSPPIAWRPSS